MLNTAFRIVGDRDDAQDVLQDAFISAFSNIDSYREEATFGAWLKRIVINRALSHLKKNRNTDLMEEGFDIIEESKPEVGVELSVEQVREAIMQLPVGFRMVLSMFLLEGYDHIEISEILNISVSTSKTQYMRARLKLKEILQKQLHYA